MLRKETQCNNAFYEDEDDDVDYCYPPSYNNSTNKENINMNKYNDNSCMSNSFQNDTVIKQNILFDDGISEHKKIKLELLPEESVLAMEKLNFNDSSNNFISQTAIPNSNCIVLSNTTPITISSSSSSILPTILSSNFNFSSISTLTTDSNCSSIGTSTNISMSSSNVSSTNINLSSCSIAFVSNSTNSIITCPLTTIITSVLTSTTQTSSPTESLPVIESTITTPSIQIGSYKPSYIYRPPPLLPPHKHQKIIYNDENPTNSTKESSVFDATLKIPSNVLDFNNDNAIDYSTTNSKKVTSYQNNDQKSENIINNSNHIKIPTSATLTNDYLPTIKSINTTKQLQMQHWLKVFSYLPIKDLLNCTLVCKSFHLWSYYRPLCSEMDLSKRSIKQVWLSPLLTIL